MTPVAPAQLQTDRGQLIAFLPGTLPESDTAALMQQARDLRRWHWQNRVQVHIINNIRNGNCQEDCGYCAQRKTAEKEIPDYGLKSDAEILQEARAALASGAYRYCMVMSGRGPGRNTVNRLKRTIQLIKSELPVQVCLSAGILTDPELARELKEAGLDRYNHNLNTSAEHYKQITTTHSYADRQATLQTMRQAGVELCSGVIAGMGEDTTALVDLAFELRALGAVSIPVNFFIPVPGHAISHPTGLNAEYCLRLLALFRLVNPAAEIRLAAGRELYLGEHLESALQLANSLFVSGYLNVKGTGPDETIAFLQQTGFELELHGEKSLNLDCEGEDHRGQEFRSAASAAPPLAPAAASAQVAMKDLADLRPFAPGD